MSVIRSVEAFPLRLPGNGGSGARYRSAPDVRSVYPERDETVVVRIATDDHVGWGEALAPVTPEAPAAIVTELIAPLLVGTEVDAPRPITFRLQEMMRERGHLNGHHADAVAAVDIALWDLVGKAAGLAVSTLLGGAYRQAVPVYLTSLGGSDPAEMAERAVAAYSGGLTAMKLHLTEDRSSVLRAVDAVLDAVAGEAADGRAARIAVDTHWVHDLATARSLGRAFDERGIWFFEAPMAPEDATGHRMLADDVATPIAVGEAMRHRFEFAEWADRRAMGIGQPDIGRTGIAEGSTIAGVLAARHVPIAPHHSMATALAYAAGLHVSAAAESFVALEYNPRTAARADFMMDAPFLRDEAVRDGAVVLPAEPGLGVEVDEHAVRRLAATFPD